MRTLLDLVLPRECGGCAAVGTLWCPRCADAMAVRPIAVRPRVDPGVPCWSLGTYTGTHRSAVIAVKERGRRDLVAPLGAALASAIVSLRLFGEIDPPELSPLVIVPAPSRARAARARGGDPVARCVRRAAAMLAPEYVVTASVLRMGRGVRDSVGLSAGERSANVRGRISFAPTGVRAYGTDHPVRDRGHTVILVDDVVTTGATVCESVSVLRDFGVEIAGVLTLASA